MKQKIQIPNIAKLLSEKSNVSQDTCETFIKTLLETITEEMTRNDEIKINGLGAFKSVIVSERESVDVTTGERITIPSFKKLTFMPDENAKRKANMATTTEPEPHKESEDGESKNVKENTSSLTVDPTPNATTEATTKPSKGVIMAHDISILLERIKTLNDQKYLKETHTSEENDREDLSPNNEVEYSTLSAIISAPEILDNARKRLTEAKEKAAKARMELQAAESNLYQAEAKAKIAKENTIRAKETADDASTEAHLFEEMIQNIEQFKKNSETSESEEKTNGELMQSIIAEASEESIDLHSQLAAIFSSATEEATTPKGTDSNASTQATISPETTAQDSTQKIEQEEENENNRSTENSLQKTDIENHHDFYDNNTGAVLNNEIIQQQSSNTANTEDETDGCSEETTNAKSTIITEANNSEQTTTLSLEENHEQDDSVQTISDVEATTNIEEDDNEPAVEVSPENSTIEIETEEEVQAEEAYNTKRDNRTTEKQQQEAIQDDHAEQQSLTSSKAENELDSSHNYHNQTNTDGTNNILVKKNRKNLYIIIVSIVIGIIGIIAFFVLSTQSDHVRTIDLTKEQPNESIVKRDISQDANKKANTSTVKSNQEKNIASKTKEENKPAFNQEKPLNTAKKSGETNLRREPKTHILTSGQSLTKISLLYYNTKDSVAAIAKANHLKDINNVPIGTKLIIP